MSGVFIAFLALLFLVAVLNQAAKAEARGNRASRGKRSRYATGRVYGIWYDSSFERDYIRYAVELDRSIESIRRYDEVQGPIAYSYRGRQRRYYPDFIVKYASGEERIIELKGYVSQKSRAKHERSRDAVKWYFEAACWDIKSKVDREALPLAELRRRGIDKPGVSRK
ncbi:MAG: hypothetical protein ISN26_02090 [Betaproteobacteria bacterium AqS2]|uniref:TnsA endonuclease N-terminal domain-containing protein n=1 Tax=Candidatus Amphirhobacter heronislandensis TaxID=1732024 RepID=A0A930UGU0_9GAMM|nr:hypothetical protein [Betaproteobacteria bacterium AqS2]